MNRLESRLKTNRDKKKLLDTFVDVCLKPELETVGLTVDNQKKVVPKPPKPPKSATTKPSDQPIGEVKHKTPAALAQNKLASEAMHKITGQKGAAKTNSAKAKKKEYNPPDHNLTDAEALTFHKMYIRAHDQETVSGYLPANMHIDSRGLIRYKRGQAPQSLKNTIPNHGRLRDNPQDRYININNNNINKLNNSTKHYVLSYAGGGVPRKRVPPLLLFWYQ